MSFPDPLLSRRSITGIHVDTRALGAYLHAVASGIVLEDMGLCSVCVGGWGGLIIVYTFRKVHGTIYSRLSLIRSPLGPCSLAGIARWPHFRK